MQLFSKGGAIRSAELHRKKQREKWIKLTLSVLGFLIIVSLPIYIFRMDQFQISNIELKGNNITKSEDLTKIIKEDLKGNYLFIFPKSNALIYPKKKILSDIKANIPRIENSQGKLLNSKTLEISISERDPAGLYCQKQTSQKECYFLDDDGYIYSVAPSFIGDVYFVYLKNPEITNPLGQSYLDKEEFKKLPPFIQSLKDLNVIPHSLQRTLNEYYLEIQGGGKIIINKDDDLGKVRENLESFLNDQVTTQAPGFLESISYIDLRFGNKVFYKLKGE